MRRLLAILLLVAVSGLAALVFLSERAVDQRQEQLEAQSQIFESSRGAMEYAVKGEGPALLILHGAGGGFDQGLLLGEAIGPAGYRQIALSRFGYLRSTLPADPSVTAQAEAIEQLLDHLGTDRVSVVAMSGGAPPALKLAEMFPERVNRVVLLSSAPITPIAVELGERPIPTWAYSALLGNDAIYWSLTKIAPARLREAFDARQDLFATLPESERAFVDTLVDGFLPGSARLRGIQNEGAAIDPVQDYDLAAVDAPVLLVHARDDRLNPFSVAQQLHAALPNSRLVALPSGGHLLLGNHEGTRSRIKRFLDVKSPS